MHEPQRRELVLRISAQQWDRIEDKIAIVGWLCFALVVPFLILLSNGVPFTSPLVLTMLGLASLGMGGVTVWYTGYPSTLAQMRETRAGYTTIVLPHRPELDLVDPVSGTIIRPAGGAAISEDEYLAAVREIAGRVLPADGAR